MQQLRIIIKLEAVMSWTKCVVIILQLWMEDVNHERMMVIDHPSDSESKSRGIEA